MMGGRCASSTRRGGLQQDNLSHHIDKVPAKDGNSWSTPSPSCPLLWSHRVHKSSAGIAGGTCTWTRRRSGSKALEISPSSCQTLIQPVCGRETSHLRNWDHSCSDTGSTRSKV